MQPFPVINGVWVSFILLLPAGDSAPPDVAVCKERLRLLTVGGTRKQMCVFVCVGVSAADGRACWEGQRDVLVKG